MVSQRLRNWLSQANGAGFSAFAILAAFSTYLCMYGFRKPFEAPTYENFELWGIQYKTILLLTQVFGYMLSKFSGIKVVAEMSPARRIIALLVLIGISELALLGFAAVPYPYNWPFLFFNGLPLGLIWGIVFSFLEGRQFTEMLGAGLCASFIIGSGIVKSVGLTLIEDYSVDIFWMPFFTGAIFIIPLLISVWLLSLVPPPSEKDIRLRTERVPMDGPARKAFFRKLAPGLIMLVVIFIFLTAYRDFRDKFAYEIWTGLGYGGQPEQMAKSETLIGICVTLLMALLIFIKKNTTAFWTSFGILMVSGVAVLASTWLWQTGGMSPEAWMIVIGFWMYLSYVAFHVTLFERLITVFRIRSNIGFLMYMADAFGYLGSVGVILYKEFGAQNVSWVTFFSQMSYAMGTVLVLLTIFAILYFRQKIQTMNMAQEAPTPCTDLSS